MAYYELANLSSGNLLGDFDAEKEALAEVREVVKKRGPQAMAGVGLLCQAQGGGKLIAEGLALAKLATEQPAPPALALA